MVSNTSSCGYQFGNPCSMRVGDINYDLSGIQVDLSEIRKGGIGRGASAPQLLANGMRMLGHGNGVYNLPFCVEKRHYSSFAIMTHENNYCEIVEVRDSIAEALKNHFSFINLPLDVNQHATLASIVVKEGNARIQIYDSVSFQNTTEYYVKLIEFIQTLLPENMQLDGNHEVVHLLDQGGEDSSGCGYYTIYTAGLLVEREDLRQFSGQPILSSSDDGKIRAELAVRTLLWYGLEKAEKELDRLRYFGETRHVFHKLDASALEKLIQSIYNSNRRCSLIDV